MSLICVHCNEEILPHERIPHVEGKMHRECMLRSVVGSVGHQMRICSCFGGNGTGDVGGLTKRENAQAAAQYFARNQERAAKAKFN